MELFGDVGPLKRAKVQYSKCSSKIHVLKGRVAIFYIGLVPVPSTGCAAWTHLQYTVLYTGTVVGRYRYLYLRR
jgi:hypothetical protein